MEKLDLHQRCLRAKQLILATCPAYNQPELGDFLTSSLKALFSETDSYQSNLFIQTINDQLKTCRCDANLTIKAISGAGPYLQGFEISLNTHNPKRHSVLLFQHRISWTREKQLALRAEHFEVTSIIPGHKYILVRAPVSEEPSEPPVYEAGITDKLWRKEMPIYSELSAVKRKNIPWLTKEFNNEKYRLLCGFNYRDGHGIPIATEEDYIRAFAWKMALKEVCYLTALRVAVSKGSIKHVLEVLDKIEQSQPLDVETPETCLPRHIHRYISSLTSWTSQVEDYNHTLERIKEEARELKIMLLRSPFNTALNVSPTHCVENELLITAIQNQQLFDECMPETFLSENSFQYLRRKDSWEYKVKYCS